MPSSFQIGLLAQQRLSRGIRLNMTEAIALLSVVLQEHIRDGTNTVAALMQHGKTILGYRHVKPGVSQILRTYRVSHRRGHGRGHVCRRHIPG